MVDSAPDKDRVGQLSDLDRDEGESVARVRDRLTISEKLLEAIGDISEIGGVYCGMSG